MWHDKQVCSVPVTKELYFPVSRQTRRLLNRSKMSGSHASVMCFREAEVPLLRLLSGLLLVFLLSLTCLPVAAQEEHSHSVAPEKLGVVDFPISCSPAVQQQFNRGVALLHSFAYSEAEEAFRGVADQDPQCAMAHWGIAMSKFRQLWEPPILPATLAPAQHEIQLAQQIGSASKRESGLINALALVYGDPTIPYRTRASNYEQAMQRVAAQNKQDTEAQVFYGLALLANESPSDKTHAKQKQAIALLEPLYRTHPQHPGIPHYLIHACDNAELAPQGLPAAREYSRIAPSAPHALHMPSHIFTRLGLWEDSIASNLAAGTAARQQDDRGEELHSMDYLVYAYLQLGRTAEAAAVVQQLDNIKKVQVAEFKAGYASTVMPIRLAVEQGQWTVAASTAPPTEAPPHVVAIAVWAKGLGLARSGHAEQAAAEIATLRRIEDQLRAAGNEYWATQTGILALEVSAWSAQADGKTEKAVSLMREAADTEDAMEKLPVTPGPVLPAREQLGYLLLAQDRPSAASKEFAMALVNAPGRRGALQGAAQASELSTRKAAAK